MNEPGTQKGRSVELRLSSIGWAAGVLAIALAVGVGAFFYGKSTGEDLDAARAEGAQAGQREGAAMGAAKGYAIGFKKGHRAGFERTYPKAYRRSYAEAFEEAGLESPDSKDIKVSSP